MSEHPHSTDHVDDLSSALRRAATAQQLLVASDYDGTLAPFVDNPDDAVPAPAGLQALVDLASLPNTTVALLSGRNRAALAHVSGAPSSLTLIGSHGSEWEGGFDQPLDAAASTLLADIHAELAEIVDRTPGAHVESKPTAAVLHVRPVFDEQARTHALEAAMAGPAAKQGVFVTQGKGVVEIAVREASKGAALETLTGQTGATVTVFLGDDVTDERGFAHLRPQDIGIKVGSGETAARYRVADIAEAVTVLAELAAARAAFINND